MKQHSTTTESLTERAYRLLEEQIVTVTLPPGELVSEASLAKRLGIGRTPVREALQRLQREGLITVLARRGIIVAPLDIRAQMQMLEVRRELERLSARKAAQRATHIERAQFAALATDMDQAAAEADTIAFMRLDREFNEALLRTVDNPFLAKTIALMAGLARRFWFLHNRRVADIGLSAARHAAIARAIAAADTKAAADASDALMDYIESITRDAIDW